MRQNSDEIVYKKNEHFQKNAKIAPFLCTFSQQYIIYEDFRTFFDKKIWKPGKHRFLRICANFETGCVIAPPRTKTPYNAFKRKIHAYLKITISTDFVAVSSPKNRQQKGQSMPKMKNPNGYGSVVKMSGRRRRPYMVRKTVGYDDRAYPVYDIIGYYATRAEAMLALAQYNADPYDLNLVKTTMKDLYELWSAEAYPDMKHSLKNCYAAAFKHCSSVYDMEYRNLRRGHMQACIDECERGYSTRSNIKLLFTQLDRFAYDHDIISKCYAANVKIGEKEESTKHTRVEDAEVVALWQQQGNQFVDETLFMLYTGCRVSEMLRLRCADVNLKNKTVTGGLKTVYGKRRTIPIHPELMPVVLRYYDPEHEFLFQRRAKQDTDSFTRWYLTKWNEAMKAAGFNHLTHDCRHTVRSKLDSAGANKVAVDRILGHSSNTIGEKVYTHKTVEELHEAIRLLSYGSLPSVSSR